MPTPTAERRPAGRPPKITNPFRYHLIVDRVVRDRAAARATRHGSDLPDVMRALMADYAAGRVRPSTLTATPEES